jgi:GNAT superfamily N-acetyltransferase
MKYLTANDQPWNARAPQLDQTVEIHHLEPTHRHDLATILTSLDRSSRCLRFGNFCSDDWLVEYAENVLDRAHVLGAFCHGNLVGFLELFDTVLAGTLEAAIVVDRRSQRKRIGSKLIQQAIARPIPNSTHLLFIFSRHNWAMRRLAERFDAKFDLVLDELSAEIKMAPIQ